MSEQAHPVNEGRMRLRLHDAKRIVQRYYPGGDPRDLVKWLQKDTSLMAFSFRHKHSYVEAFDWLERISRRGFYWTGRRVDAADYDEGGFVLYDDVPVSVCPNCGRLGWVYAKAGITTHMVFVTNGFCQDIERQCRYGPIE